MRERARHHRSSGRARPLRGRARVRVRHRPGRGAALAADPGQRITRITVAGNAGAAGAGDPPRAHRSIRRDAVGEPHRRDGRVGSPSYYPTAASSSASILPRVQDDDPAPERVRAGADDRGGPRIAVGAVTVTGTPLEPEAEVIRLLGLQPGRPFDQVALEARIAALRRIAARARLLPGARARDRTCSPAATARSVNVTVAVEPGPHVSLVFAGDPLPEGNRDTLVPIRAERARRPGPARGREPQHRERAARAGLSSGARALHARREGRRAGADLHDRARPAASRRIGRDRGQRQRSPPRTSRRCCRSRPAIRLSKRASALIAAAITELYRVRGFAQAAVKPDIQVLPEAQARAT